MQLTSRIEGAMYPVPTSLFELALYYVVLSLRRCRPA